VLWTALPIGRLSHNNDGAPVRSLVLRTLRSLVLWTAIGAPFSKGRLSFVGDRRSLSVACPSDGAPVRSLGLTSGAPVRSLGLTSGAPVRSLVLWTLRSLGRPALRFFLKVACPRRSALRFLKVACRTIMSLFKGRLPTQRSLAYSKGRLPTQKVACLLKGRPPLVGAPFKARLSHNNDAVSKSDRRSAVGDWRSPLGGRRSSSSSSSSSAMAIGGPYRPLGLWPFCRFAGKKRTL
jgi:hypothetical protein